MAKNFIFVLLGLIVSKSSWAQDAIMMRASSLEEEVDYIWRNIQDISFFKENGYDVAFPKLEHIKVLKEKSRAGKLDDDDYSKLKSIFSDSVYRPSNYQAGLEKLAQNQQLIETMIQDLKKLDLNWKFKFHRPYVVKLTLYGPGGSYDPDSGHILLFTTRDGKFKQYEDPACTIIHEVVHMGIEQSLIQKFNVSHTLKERIVDQFVLLNFQEYLPEYRVQDMGDYRADQFMQSKEDLQHLHQTLQNALSE